MNRRHRNHVRVMMTAFLALLAMAACDGRTPNASPDDRATSTIAGDSARRAFAQVVDSLLLDTRNHELRAQVSVVVHNPNRDDESPFSMSPLRVGASPGHHTRDGEVYADIEVLRELLGREVPVRVDSANHRFFLGSPEVLIYGHPHGNAWFVPVKLFARQFGAYTDIGCTLTTCANIWPRNMLEYAKEKNVIGTAMLEAHAEGLIDIDVRRLPTG